MIKTFIEKIFVIYKNFISPVLILMFGKGCIYTPTCSEYSKHAFQKYGVLKGAALSLKRVIKCNPFSKPAYDPVS